MENLGDKIMALQMKKYAFLSLMIFASQGYSQQQSEYYYIDSSQQQYYHSSQQYEGYSKYSGNSHTGTNPVNPTPSTNNNLQIQPDQKNSNAKLKTDNSQAKPNQENDNAKQSLDTANGAKEKKSEDKDEKEETPSPAPYPLMSAGLSANPNPAIFDAGPLGKLIVTGVLSGIGFWQTHPAIDFFGHENDRGYVDISNATVILNKTEGKIQFFIQAGAYSIPALGVPYVKSHKFDRKTFGFIQQGFVKLEPNKIIDIKIGALPTLMGAEYAFTFENFNIQRGLLWNQENAVTKGIQLDFSKDPWTVSVSWNDGFYTDQYTSESALITYTFKNKDTFTAVAMGNYFGKVRHDSFVAPVALANSQMYSLIYTCTRGPWVFNPYIQYTTVPTVRHWTPSGSTIGAAMLAKYSFNAEISCSGRLEAINSSGRANLLYGPRSSAWSIAITPTYQKGIFFFRAEGSYVSIISGKNGFMFGSNGKKKNQTRLFVETGVIF
jgi:hypothetical protein